MRLTRTSCCAAHRQVDPEAPDSHGKPYGDGVYFCTLQHRVGECPLVTNKSGYTKNFWRHLEKHDIHPSQSAGSKRDHKSILSAPPQLGSAAAAAARLFAGRTDEGGAAQQSARASTGSGADRTFRKPLTQFFDKPQLQRFLVAALLLTGTATNILKNVFFKLFLLAVSGGFLKGVDPKTASGIETSFVEQLTDNVLKMLVDAKIIKEDRTGPVRHPLPRYTISCDKSTSDIQGWQTITINLHFITAERKKKKVNLGVLKFQLSGDVEVSKGTGKNIAAFIVNRLKYWKLVPAHQQGLDISDYCATVTSDNASTELNAVVEHLNCASQSCSSHSLALVLKNALCPKGVRSRPLLLMDRLAALAKKCKKGKGVAQLIHDQKTSAVPVLNPLSLVSRCHTRWTDAYRMLHRAIQLRAWLSNAFLRAGEPAFSDDDWTVIIQTAAVLRVFYLATVALQSTQLCIGAHLVVLDRLAKQMYKPELIRMHAEDFTPSASELNRVRGTDKFDLWDEQYTTLAGTDDNMHPDVRSLIDDIVQQLKYRSNTDPAVSGKRQLNSLSSVVALFFEPTMKWLAFKHKSESFILSPKHRMDAKVELLRLMRLLPAAVDAFSEPAPKRTKPSFLDFASDPLLSQQPESAPQAATAPREDAAAAELRRWEAANTTGKEMWAFWSSAEAARDFPLLTLVFFFLVITEHSNAGCERDFSELARLLTPLRRGRMHVRTVERKMILLLNRKDWHPLPERREERIVQELMTQAGAADWVDSEEEVDTSSDSSDDDFEV